MIYSLGDVVRCNYSLFSVQDFLCEIVVICEDTAGKETHYGVEQIAEPNVWPVVGLTSISKELLNYWLNSAIYKYTYTSNILNKNVGLWPQEKHLTLVRSCVFSTVKNCTVGNTITNNNPHGEICLDNPAGFILPDYDEEDGGGLRYL